MAKLSILAGSTSQTINIFIQDSSSTTGAGLTGLVFNTSSLVAYYALPKAAAVQITLATLAAITTAYSSGGFKEVDATNMPGWYRLDLPDAAIASGRFVSVHLKGATNMAPCPIEVELTAWNNQDAVRGGLTALPNANAAAAGGLMILGTNATATSFTAGLTISNAGGDALVLTSSGSNGNALNASGNGTGAGIKATGGATGNGLSLVGGATSGDALLTATTSGHGATFAGTGTTKHGINATGGATTSSGISAAGGGTGAGILATGGATGPAARFTGGGTSGVGIAITTTSGDGISVLPTVGHGLVLTANGTTKHGLTATGGSTTSNGILATGGGTGHGISAVSGGGATGDGFHAASASSDGFGMAAYGTGTGSGFQAAGGVTGHGLSLLGGGISGDGLNSIATVSGHGITATGVGTTKHGLNATGGSTTSHGISATGGGVGHGILATSGGGATGDGIRGTSVATNGNGFNLIGVGTGSGILTTGGATGRGLYALGGATSGAGIRSEAQGSGGQGLHLLGNGTGAGMKVDAGATAIGLNILGGATSGAGITVTTTSGDGLVLMPTAGSGLVTTGNGTSKHGIISTGGTAGTSDGISAVAGTGGVPIRGDITGNITGNLSGSVDRVTTILIRTNTAQAGGASTITLDASASATDNLYRNEVISIASGTGTGQSNIIASYVGATKVATVATAWATAPDNTSVFVISAFGPSIASVSGTVNANVIQWLGTAVSTPTVAGVPNVNVKTWNDLTTVALPLVPTTAGRTLDVSATGEAGIDWANIGAPTTTVNLSGTTIAPTQKVDIETIKTNPVVNAGTVTFPANATLASTTNITGGTITTVTNLTNAPTNGDLTATMKTSVENTVWDAAIASHLSAGSTGFALNEASTAGDPWITALPGAYGAGTAGFIVGTNLDAAVTTRLAPTVAGRTLDVSAGGEAGLDWANIGSPTTAHNLSATNIDPDQVVASVTGAVGSVTGSVGSVTGNVGGNVIGAVGSVTGNVGGNVVGSVASVSGNVGGNVVGSVASVVGAVGSVTGNVGGNVAGSVGSVTGNLGGNVVGDVNGNVVGSVASVVGNVGGNVTGSVGSVTSDVGITQAGADKVFSASGAAMAELGVGAPVATPNPRQAVMLQYMTLRNKLTTTATAKTIFNDAGSAITSKQLADDGTTYTESEMA